MNSSSETEQQGDPDAGAAQVISEQTLTTTQLEVSENIFIAPARMYKLSEAEFFALIEPPPANHNWLQVSRSAFFGSTIALVALLLGGDKSSIQVRIAAVAAGVATAALIGFKIHAIFWPGRRQRIIDAIRATWVEAPKR
jgi:hypothetical protein